MVVISQHKKNKLQPILIGLLLFALLLPGGAWARPVLKLGYIEFPPYYFTNELGQAEGHLIELSRLLADSAGYDLDIRALPTRRAAQMLAAGEIDFWLGLATITEQAEQVLISQVVVDTIQLQIYSLSPLPEVVDKDYLLGRKVVLLRGYRYGGWTDFIQAPESNTEIYLANNHHQAVKTLVGRGYDFLLDYRLPIKRTLEQIDAPPLFVADIHSLNVHILVSTHHPQAHRLLQLFEAAYLSLGERNPVLKK
jgi:polar amino acid transport system substrate-binding protein